MPSRGVSGLPRGPSPSVRVQCARASRAVVLADNRWALLGLVLPVAGGLLLLGWVRQRQGLRAPGLLLASSVRFCRSGSTVSPHGTGARTSRTGPRLFEADSGWTASRSCGKAEGPASLRGSGARPAV